MRPIEWWLVLIGVCLFLFSCAPVCPVDPSYYLARITPAGSAFSQSFTPSPIPSPVPTPPPSITGYFTSFETITDPDAQGITSITNNIGLTRTLYHSGAQAIEAADPYDPDKPLTIDFNTTTLGIPGDISKKTIRIYVFVPATSSLQSISFTAFRNPDVDKNFVTFGNTGITKGEWNRVTFDMQNIYENIGFFPGYIAGQTLSDEQENMISAIIQNCQLLEVLGSRSEQNEKDEMIVDDVNITDSPDIYNLPFDDSVDSLRKYAEQTHLLIGNVLLDTPFFQDSDDNRLPYLKTLVQEFDLMITSHGSMLNLETQRGVYNFSLDEKMVDFANNNHLAVRGPTLGWNNAVPGWVEQIPFLTYCRLIVDGNHPASETCNWKQYLMDVQSDYIHNVISQYRGKIKIWDAFNEVANYYVDSDPNSATYCVSGRETTCKYGLRNRNGAGTYGYSIWAENETDSALIESAFVKAHAEDESSQLFLNDYQNEEIGTPKAEYFYQFVKGLKAKGIPIHGVGFQLHLREDEVTDADLDKIEANVMRYQCLCLQVQFTEVDILIRTDDLGEPGSLEYISKLGARELHQALIYRRLMNIALRNPNVTAFLLFGLTDRYSPIAEQTNSDNITAGSPDRYGYAHIFDEDFRPKPAYYAMLDELKAYVAQHPTNP